MELFSIRTRCDACSPVGSLARLACHQQIIQAHTHTHRHSFSHSLTLSLSLSLTHPLTHSLTNNKTCINTLRKPTNAREENTPPSLIETITALITFKIISRVAPNDKFTMTVPRAISSVLSLCSPILSLLQEEKKSATK